MDIISLLKAATVYELIMGLVVVSNVALWVSRSKASYKYAQQDKLLLLLCYIVAPSAVKIHRSGDYEIVNPLNKEVE